MIRAIRTAGSRRVHGMRGGRALGLEGHEVDDRLRSGDRPGRQRAPAARCLASCGVVTRPHQRPKHRGRRERDRDRCGGARPRWRRHRRRGADRLAAHEHPDGDAHRRRPRCRGEPQCRSRCSSGSTRRRCRPRSTNATKAHGAARPRARTAARRPPAVTAGAQRSAAQQPVVVARARGDRGGAEERADRDRGRQQPECSRRGCPTAAAYGTTSASATVPERAGDGDDHEGAADQPIAEEVGARRRRASAPTRGRDPAGSAARVWRSPSRSTADTRKVVALMASATAGRPRRGAGRRARSRAPATTAPRCRTARARRRSGPRGRGRGAPRSGPPRTAGWRARRGRRAGAAHPTGTAGAWRRRARRGRGRRRASPRCDRSGRRGWRAPGRCPTNPASDTAVTAAAQAGEPVRSSTRTASASRPAQSPSSETMSASPEAPEVGRMRSGRRSSARRAAGATARSPRHRAERYGCPTHRARTLPPCVVAVRRASGR